MQKVTHKKPIGARTVHFLLLAMVILIGISFSPSVNAADFDNVLQAEPTDGYPTLRIVNAYGLPWFGNTLAEINILENSEQCLLNCYTTGTIKLYVDDTIFDSIEFVNKSRHIKYNDYNIYLEVEDREDYIVKDYETQCEMQDFGNETREVCEEVEVGEHEEETITYDWQKYQGEELEGTEEGITYKWKIESKRDEIKFGDSRDWSFGMMGIEPEEVREHYIWWETDWKKRKNVRFEGGVSELINFTVFLNITYDSDMQVDFEDLRFARSLTGSGACNGTQDDELSFELDYKIDSNYANVWILIPNLTIGPNNFICMYYDNSGASSASNGPNTWDKDYIFVYHFSDGNGVDSIGTYTATVVTGTVTAPGLGFGVAQIFDGAADSYTITTASTLPPFDMPMTIEIVQKDTNSSNYAPFMAKSGGPPKQFYIAREGATSGVYTETANSNFGSDATSTEGVDYGPAGDYFTYQCFDATDCNYYNKSKVLFATHSNGATVENSDDFKIGRDGGGNLVSTTFDELRYSNISRSSSWINRSVDNLNFSFFAFGAEEALASIDVTLFTPTDGQNFTQGVINFSCNATIDTNTNGVVNLTLFLDGVSNITVFNSTGFQNLSIDVSYNLSDGNYNYTCEGNTFTVNEVIAARSFTIHTKPVSLIISQPIGDLGINKGENITLSWVIAEASEDLTTHVKNCSYLYNGVTTNLLSTVCIGVNTTSFIYVTGQDNLLFSVTEEFNLITTNTTSWSFSISAGNTTFSNVTPETSRQNLTYNFTTSIDFISISAILDYNGTNITSAVSCTGENCTASNEFDIPLVLNDESQLNNFSWIIDIFNDTDTFNFTSAIETQNVTRIHLEKCDGGAFDTQVFNFTVADEETLDAVNPFLFNGFFELWLGSGSIRRNNSFGVAAGFNSTSQVLLCAVPEDINFTMDANIEYDKGEGSVGNYNARTYQLQSELVNNISDNITLFLLNSTTATSFIIKVRDDNLLPLPNHIVITERFYPGTGTFEAVQIGITGPSGETVGFFQTETVDYRFIVMFNGEILLTTAQEKVIGKTTPFTITLTVGTNLGAPWQGLEPLGEFATNLTFNRSTDRVVYSWIDSSGNFSEAILIVTQINNSGFTNESLCISNSSSASGSLICDINNNGSYTATGYIRRGTTTTIVAQIVFTLQRLSDILGLYGVFLGWIVLLVLSFTFKFNEIAAVWLVFFGMIVINYIGIINFGGTWLTVFGATAILLTIVLKR